MRILLSIAMLGLVLPPLDCLAEEGKPARNPFGVTDVPDPDGKDVADFAAKAKDQLKADDKDPNAAQWAKEATKGENGSLDGDWNQRWDGGAAGGKAIEGTAKIKTVGDRVYILYKDRTNTYLIDAKREGKLLIGRYINQGVPSDTTPFYGVIVDNERIDGLWSMGRWDSRRKLASEK